MVSKENGMGSSGHRSGHSKADIQVLYSQVDELKEMVSAMASMPEEIKSLRKTVKSLSGDRGSCSEIDAADFKKLKDGCVKLQSNMKKQNAILTKELAEAKSSIKDYQRDIDALKMEVREATKKASNAENEAKKAQAGASSMGSADVSKELAAAKTKLDEQEVRIEEQQREIDILKQELRSMSSGQKAYPSKAVGSSVPSGMTSTSRRGVSESSPARRRSPSPPVASDDSSSSSESEESDANLDSKVEGSDSESDSEQEERARKELEKLRKKREDDSDFESDSDSAPSKPRSFLPRKPADSDSDTEPSKPSTQRAQRRGRERKFEAHNVPRGRQAFADDDSDSEGEGDIEIDIDDDEEPMPLPPPGTFNRRSSIASVESVESVDTTPRKKTISLLPHKSADLYEEQRKDTALRKLMIKGKSSNMKVRKVHGKSLVFFSDRIYIPESLRQKSLDFYWERCKKQKLNPLVHLEKNCFWPDMKEQYKRYDLEKSGKYVQVEVSYVKYKGSKPKDELNYDCVGLGDD